MDTDKTFETLKYIVSAYNELEIMTESLRKLGIDIQASAIDTAKDYLSDCICDMYEIETNDMIGDDILNLLSNTELCKEELFDKLYNLIGENGLME